MSKIILTDVDEVIFDWQTPFEKWILSSGRYSPEQPLKKFWDIERWLNIPYEEGHELVQEFNHMEEHWANFEPLPGVVRNVLQLEDQGYKFVAVTACAEDEWTYTHRWHNLRKCFGTAFDTLHCVGLSQPKKDILARYRPTVWVEDKLRHAIDGADLGHKSFLINYNWNQYADDERITRVSGWDEITAEILGS